MSRNAKILVHRCFDPSSLDYEAVGGTQLFVRFPKEQCGCHERVTIAERNAMVADGKAVVVVRGEALPSLDKFSWKEIAVIVSRGRYKFAARGRMISAADIERAYVR